MRVTKCDKCGKVYSDLEDMEEIAKYELNKKYWRYDLYLYPQEKVDLCNDCKKDLYNWLQGVGKYAKE